MNTRTALVFVTAIAGGCRDSGASGLNGMPDASPQRSDSVAATDSAAKALETKCLVNDRFEGEAGTALLLGQKVRAVQAAIEHPDNPRALAAVTALGLDSRYDVLVRGWLTAQLQGDLDILAANGDRTPPHITTRIEFIRKALRAIDLE